MKLRPVLLLAGAIGPGPGSAGFLYSSVIPSQLLPSDLVLDPGKPQFRSTNLKILSALRLHKLATIPISSLVRYFGVVDVPTFDLAAKKLAVLLAL
jgi:mRNA interferase MazF